jgi:site-specific recombinase XerD
MKTRKDLAPALRFYSRWRKRRRIARGLADGALAGWWDDLASFLLKRGYAWDTVRRVIGISKTFEVWAQSLGVHNASAVSDDLIARYLRSGRRPKKSQKCLELLMGFLRQQEIVPKRKPESGPPRSMAIIDEYLEFLRHQRGTGAITAERHRHYIESFLNAVSRRTAKRLRGLTGAEIQRFITSRAAALSREGRKKLCAAIRSFLRFLFIGGYTAVDLASSVPIIPSFKLERLPRAISNEAIERILAAINRSTPVGKRDYAMLLLLATYGMRAGQLCALRLEDIDWRMNLLRIPGTKGGRNVLLPLRSAAGEAIVEYLKRGRPVGWPFREVFLRARSPIGPLRVLSAIIKPYAQRAGVEIPSFGSHAWRHACATRMLAKGESLKTIRHILGHQSIETTFIYTKVDLEALRQAALEWLEEVQ